MVFLSTTVLLSTPYRALPSISAIVPVICSYKPAHLRHVVFFCYPLRVEIIRAEFYNRVLIDNQEQTAIHHSEVFRAGDEFRTGRRHSASTRIQRCDAVAVEAPPAPISRNCKIGDLPYLELRGNQKKLKNRYRLTTVAEPPIKCVK